MALYPPSKFEFEQDLPSLYRPARYWRVLTRSYSTARRPNQTNIRQGSIFLAKSRERANYANSHGAFRLFTVPGLILGIFDRPHWLSPPRHLGILTWNVSSCRSAVEVSNPRSRIINWDLAFSGPSPIVGSSACNQSINQLINQSINHVSSNQRGGSIDLVSIGLDSIRSALI